MKKYLIALLVLALGLRLWYLDLSYIFWDESIYLMQAGDLAGRIGMTEYNIRPPLLSVIIAPFAFFENDVLLSKLFMILLSLVFIYLVYRLGLYFSPFVAFFSALFASVLPFHIMASSWVMTDVHAATLFLATILLYYEGLENKKKNCVYAAGIMLSLAVLMKFTNLFLLIVLSPLW